MKTYHILLMIALISGTGYAQAPTYQWAKSAGSNSTSEGRAITTDIHGNVLITGGFQSPTLTFETTTLTLTGTNTSNIFIAKYNTNGNLMWAKNVGGTGIGEHGWAIATDTSGNAFITGFFYSPTISFGNITINNTGTNRSNIFIAKYDPNGNVLWAKNAGAMYITGSGFGISCDVNGNAFITGGYDSQNITIGTTTLTNVGGNSGSRDLFIAKYDANGNALWAKSAGGGANDQGRGVSTDAGGNVFITGEFTSATIYFGNTMLTNTLGSGGDLFIAKYDPNGNELWAKSAGGPGGDEGRGISVDTSGNAFITGTFEGQNFTIGTTTLTNSGYSSILVAKYDTNGNVIWAKNSVGNENDYGLSISTDRFGNAFITGEFYSDTIAFGNNTLINSGYRDIFIAKYDANGNVLWTDSKGGVTMESGYGIAADASGDVFITGNFDSPSITFGNTTFSNNSGYFITKLSQTTGLEVIQTEPNVNIAPNPFTYQTTVSFRSEQINSTVKLIDILGKKIKEFNFSGKELIIEKGTMQEGLYFLETTDEMKRVRISKIIIQ